MSIVNYGTPTAFAFYNSNKTLELLYVAITRIEMCIGLLTEIKIFSLITNSTISHSKYQKYSHLPFSTIHRS